MENPRKYGRPPFKVALIHGGPGAAGEMEPVARTLLAKVGVLEPLQTARSLGGQVEELRSILLAEGGGPFILAGFSWGAWLSLILAARCPELVKKLILIGSGPFEEKDAHTISEVRFSRLSAAGRGEAPRLIKLVEGPDVPGRAEALARLGKLLSGTDAYDPEPAAALPGGAVMLDADIFQRVWKEAADLRRSGGLLACAGRISCPVTAIHGDHDPHPASGVSAPLSRLVKNFNFALLKDCGHKPWIEKKAKTEFYEVLLQGFKD